jgi:hypothetical protein
MTGTPVAAVSSPARRASLSPVPTSPVLTVARPLHPSMLSMAMARAARLVTPSGSLAADSERGERPHSAPPVSLSPARAALDAAAAASQAADVAAAVAALAAGEGTPVARSAVAGRESASVDAQSPRAEGSDLGAAPESAGQRRRRRRRAAAAAATAASASLSPAE